MPSPLLATKLHVPPPRPQIVARPRLLGRLGSETASRKVALVCAPAGFGKTTILTEWIALCRRHNPEIGVAWLSLDGGDNDPVRFLTYTVAALQGVDPDIGAETLSFVHGAQVLPMELALTALVNDVERMGDGIILVLDDYHVITSRQVQDALMFLLEHLPARLQVAIASRSDPPFPLARMRSRGELTELRAADLRFTHDEAADFLNRLMGLGLSSDDITALETRTEGWIAGLQLAALSLRDHEDAPGFVRAFSGSQRFILDYLVEEALQRQTDDVRNFLLRTAVLDRLSASLCEVLTGETSSRSVLESLERNNLFIVPLDDRREWYRYHHLFADVLRSRLLNEEPGRVPALHHAASEWYERNDLPEEAVKHALAAGEFGRAVQLMESALPDMRRHRQDAMLLSWLKLLPEDVVRRSPVLSVFNAWRMLVAGDLEAVESWLRDAEQGLAAGAGNGGRSEGHGAGFMVAGEELQNLPATIAIYRASLSQAVGDVEATAEHAQHALELTAPGDHLGRAGASGFLGMASWAAGDLERAIAIFSDAVTSLHAAGNVADEWSSTIVLADMWVARGCLQKARQLYERALQRASTQEGEHFRQATADLHVGISELDCEIGEPGAAREHLQTAAELRGSASSTENGYRQFVALARVSQAAGDLNRAIELLCEAERLYMPGFFPDVRPIAGVKARVRILQGRLPEAWDWIRERGLCATDDLSYLHEFEHLTLARLLIAQYRVDGAESVILEAVGLLDRLLGAADLSGQTGSVNEILILQALAQEAQGHTVLAQAPLERALVATAPEGYVRLFVDEGAPMAALLNDTGPGVAPDHVARLLRVFRAAEGEAPTAPTIAVPSSEALSNRELQVLGLLSTELTGPEIARDLFVSLNTLRSHTKHIFTKLDVNSRTAAVRSAKDQGLI